MLFIAVPVYTMTREGQHPSPGIGRSAVVWNIRPIQAQLPICLAMVEKPTYYPPLARAARLYGVVTVNFQIGQDGRPFDTVLDGNGNPDQRNRVHPESHPIRSAV